MLSMIPFFRSSISTLLRFSVPLALMLGAYFASGCSSGMSMNPPPETTPTSVVVALTGTANDKLVQFYITIASINLVDKARNTVNLYTNTNTQGFHSGNAEFIHLNGNSEPIVTAMVPQGVYTEATVTVAACSFTKVTVNAQGGVVQSTYAEGLCGQGTGKTTVNLPAPITVSGSAMALSLDLQVTQSFTLNVNAFPQPTYTISPVFTLKPLTLSPQPSNQLNGKFNGIDAQITSIDSATNSFVAQTADGFPLTVHSGAGTVFQGIAAFSTLTANTLVNLDVATQPDGSLLASRVEVDNLAAPTTSIGPFLAPVSPVPQFLTIPIETEGCTITGTPFCGSTSTTTTIPSSDSRASSVTFRIFPFPPRLLGLGCCSVRIFRCFPRDN